MNVVIIICSTEFRGEDKESEIPQLERILRDVIVFI